VGSNKFEYLAVWKGHKSVDLATRGTFSKAHPYFDMRDVMKAYFEKLPAALWALFMLPAVALAYPIVRIVVPVVVNAVVPETVRTVLHLI